MCVILQKAVFSIVTRMLLVTMFGRDWMKPIFVKQPAFAILLILQRVLLN